jgi:DNA-binding transcriptional LysR family regulator
MHLTWLEDFVELARTRSFSRAAENRFITHPAFGRRIQSLERWVGTNLVSRTQPVTLTAAGMQFLDAASQAIDILQAARTQLQDGPDAATDILRIATGRTLARTFFPDWYETINQRFGPFLVSLVTCGAQEAITHLANGDVDLMLIYSSTVTRLLIDPQRFESITLDREILLPVSAPDARGRPKFNLQAEQTLSPVPWLGFSKSLTLRGVLANHLASLPHKLRLRMVYQADSYESILEMAKRGAGVAWLPQRLLQPELLQDRLLHAGDSNLRVAFDISLYRLRASTNPLVNTIWHGVCPDPMLKH